MKGGLRFDVPIGTSEPPGSVPDLSFEYVFFGLYTKSC